MAKRRLGRRPLRQSLDQRANPVRQTAQDGVRERDGAFQPGTANELDGLVHRGIPRDAIEERELVGAEPQRSANWRVQLGDRPPTKRLDRVIERPHALHRAVGKPAREGAVAVVKLT